MTRSWPVHDSGVIWRKQWGWQCTQVDYRRTGLRTIFRVGSNERFVQLRRCQRMR